MSSNPSSSSMTETYAATTITTEVTVIPRVVTQSEQIARYFTEDLSKFVQDTNINLVTELQIPPDLADSSGGLDTEAIIEMLFDDIAHMLRDTLITGVHLMISERYTDPNTGAYPLRYHAEYTVSKPPPDPQRQKAEEGKRWGGHLAPPKNIWNNARFAMLIDWNPSANERRRQVRRPRYCFDWVPEHSRFDDTSLVRYREGGMTADGASVVVHRQESASPGFDLKGRGR